MTTAGKTLLAFLGILAAANVMADVKLASIFTDNMVLQRDMPVPVWGTASPGEELSVSFGGQVKSAKAGPDGKWRLALDPLQMSKEPRALSVKGSSSLVLKNVLVGEVWICAGQSNMAFHLYEAKDGKEEAAKARLPEMRFFQVSESTTSQPQESCVGSWSVCTPETAGKFSAVGFFFGRGLYEKLDVPVGLIESAWGGTPIEAWTPIDKFEGPDMQKYVELYKKHSAWSKEDVERLNEEALQKARQEDKGNEGEKSGWQNPDAGSEGWRAVKMPHRIHMDSEIGPINGSVWYRRKVEIPAEWAGAEIVLKLGVTSQLDTVYFNGTKAGGTGRETKNYAKIQRSYKIPGSLVKAGSNTIAVRIFNECDDGGMLGPAKAMEIEGKDARKISLADEWQFRIETKLPRVRASYPRVFCTPSYLYNAMIAPLIPFAIKGAIWYQGEQNTTPGGGREYRKLLPGMISAWREKWGQGDFPFCFVQLPNFMPKQANPSESEWSELREAQLMTLSLPNTGMAVAIDLGEEKDVHPKNKKDVGARLALAARALAYGERTEFSGPLYKRMKIEGSSVRISFSHAESGLESRGGEKLKGFAICGADSKFVWADARIEGSEVMVWSDAVKAPSAVRYAWGNSPDCDLYSKAGLPASPFRTDADSHGKATAK